MILFRQCCKETNTHTLEAPREIPASSKIVVVVVVIVIVVVVIVVVVVALHANQD